jgi:hypothetical protein
MFAGRVESLAYPVAGRATGGTSMYSRSKESKLDTIGYEIEMLRYCREQIQAEPSPPETSATILAIEGFLLHFRNLIRFFSGKRPRPYDLSTADPEAWAGRPLNEDEIMLFQVAAESIDEEYYQAISKYLQHCTALAQKAEREWNFEGMFEEIAPLIREFERRFLVLPAKPPASDASNSATGVSSARLLIVPDKGQA